MAPVLQCILVLLLAAPGFYSLPIAEDNIGLDVLTKGEATLDITVEDDRAAALVRERRTTSDCISDLYVFAHTSTRDSGAGTNDVHDIEIRISGAGNYVSPLRDMPGNQATAGKGDLWKLSLTSDFHVPSSPCTTKNSVDYIAIVEAGNDGWMIDSIITIFKYSNGRYEVATLDMDVHKWIDGDGDPNVQPGVVTRFELTLI